MPRISRKWICRKWFVKYESYENLASIPYICSKEEKPAFVWFQWFVRSQNKRLKIEIAKSQLVSAKYEKHIRALTTFSNQALKRTTGKKWICFQVFCLSSAYQRKNTFLSGNPFNAKICQHLLENNKNNK